MLGGCCCSHVGAIESLAAGEECLAVVWIDAHGDLNTPETSPSGNAWGMPLRMAIDRGAVLPEHVALSGRATSIRRRSSSSPPRVSASANSRSMPRSKVPTRSTSRSTATRFEPGELAVFMPEPDGLTLAEVERLLSGGRGATLAWPASGSTGLVADPANEPKLARLCSALGL